MPDPTILDVAGKLSKPATVLIEKVSSAIGVVYEPRRIKKRAEAEAEAAVIKARASIEIGEMEQRAIDRLIATESRRQKNLEQITQIACHELAEDAEPDKLDDDWIENFFEKSKMVSDSEMQQLWGKILAGEANSAGSFSKRTIAAVAGLEKSEAHLFSNLCGFCMERDGSYYPFILKPDEKIYNDKGLTFDTLTHLESIGLINFDNLKNFALVRMPPKFTLIYFDETIDFKLPPDSDKTFPVGKVLLTKTGQELAAISGAQKEKDFSDYIKTHRQAFLIK